MRIALLTEPDWESAPRLADVFGRAGHEVVVNPDWDVLRKFHAGMLRGAYWEPAFEILMAKAVLLESRGVRFLNSLCCLGRADDKAVATELFRDAGLNTPITWVRQPFEGLPAVTGSLVIKPRRGAKQKGVEVFSQIAGATAYLRGCSSAQVIQRFVRGYYWRVITTPQALVRVYTAPSDERGITSLPVGQEREIQLHPKPSLVDAAMRTVAAVGGNLMGVDILEDEDGSMWVLEANNAFGFNAGDVLVESAFVDVMERLVPLAPALTANDAGRIDSPVEP